MSVRVLYFAWVREQAGVAEEMVNLEAPTTLAALADRLAGRSEGHARALSDRGRLRAAVNQEFSPWEAEVRPGDEVALFPPVTGG